MYMPGRLRTASRPSRTVLSFASYEDARGANSGATFHERVVVTDRNMAEERRFGRPKKRPENPFRTGFNGTRAGGSDRANAGLNSDDFQARDVFDSTAQIGLQKPELRAPDRLVDVDHEHT